MPWNPPDASKHTHLANTAAKRRQWAAVANSALERTGDDATAIREANAVVHEHPAGRKHSADGSGHWSRH